MRIRLYVQQEEAMDVKARASMPRLGRVPHEIPDNTFPGKVARIADALASGHPDPDDGD